MHFSQQITPEQEANISASIRLAQLCEYPSQHTHHITRLALRIFDDLVELHHMGPQQRYWLQCAAILHDIGWIEGEKAHHKATLRIILDSPVLTFSSNERLIIASIARYHRRALPSPRHDHYAALSPTEQQSVSQLAAILRVADGLDAMDQSRVKEVQARFTPTKIIITYFAPGRAREEEKRTSEKSDLMREIYNKTLSIQWKHNPA